jgi:hypothetical protein
VIDGRIAGTWTRRVTTAGVTITPAPFAKLAAMHRRALAAAADRYGQFLGRPARLV